MIVCGVPGSGKTWVCEQLTQKFKYIPHDHYIGRIGEPGRFGSADRPPSEKPFLDALEKAAMEGDQPVLTECPFAERELVTQLLRRGLSVDSVFIVEPVEIVRERYHKRSGKDISKSTETRCKTIVNRAVEWNKRYGRCESVLKYLQDLQLEPAP